MPTAKITTRTLTTTTVTEDNLAKGTALTAEELDSNFINLKTAVEAAGSGGSGGNLGNLQVNDTTLSPVTTNDNLNLVANGTGRVVLEGQSWPSTDGISGYVLTTDGAGDLTWSDLGGVTITNNTITTEASNSDLTIQGNGTGVINIVGNVVNINNPSLTGVDSLVNIGDLVITGDHISTGNTNGDIILETQGGGGISLDSDIVRARRITGYTAATRNFKFADSPGQDLDLYTNYPEEGYTSIKMGGANPLSSIKFYAGGKLEMQSFWMELGYDYDGSTGDNVFIGTKQASNLYITSDHRSSLTSSNVDDRSYIKIPRANEAGTAVDGTMTIHAQGGITGVKNLNIEADKIIFGEYDGSTLSTISLTTSGDENLRLDTNKGVTTGFIQIDAGANGDITIETEGTGTVEIQTTTNITGALDVTGAATLDTSLTLATGATITEFSTDTTMAGNSDTAVPTEQAVKTYVDNTFASETGFIIVGDDSTGSTIGDTETLRVIGAQNVTTSVSGDTLTITGPNLDNIITVVGDDSTGTSFNKGESIKIAGGTGIASAVTGDTITLDIDNTVATLTGSQTLTNKVIQSATIDSGTINNANIGFTTPALGFFTTVDAREIYLTNDSNEEGLKLQDNVITVLGSNQDLELRTNAAGSIVLDGLRWPTADGTSGQALITNGSGQLSFTSLSQLTGITFVGDDSTGSTINTAETLKIAGTQNITTAVSGDTVTITGPDLSSFATASSTTTFTNKSGNISQWTNDSAYLTNSTITVVGDDSTGTTLNSGETIKVAGAEGITTAVTGDTVTITGPSLDNLFTVVGDDSTGTSFNRGETIKIDGGVGVATTMSGDTLTISLVATDDLIVSGTTVSAPSNSDLIFNTSGTGYIILDGQKWPQADGTANQLLKTDGAGNLSWSTGSTNLADDATPQLGGDLDVNGNDIISVSNADINILPNGTGKTVLGSEFNGTTLPYTNVSNSYPEHDDGNIRANLQFYSNLSVPNITTFAERQFANTRYVIGKADSSATTYNSGNFRFQNTDLLLFDMNGATANSTLTNSRSAAIRGVSTTVGFKNSGGGTKITPNMIGINGFFELQEGHGGDLTTVNAIAVRGSGTVRGSTTDISRITNAFNFLSEPISTGGSGTNGVARIVTNEYGFYHDPTTAASLVTNHYGLYINSGSAATNKYGVVVADAAYSNTLGGITLQSGAISTADSTAIQIDEGLNVSGTLNAKIMVTNEISSEDSTAIQINEAVNVSGTLTANSGATINGTLTANTITTSNISSASGDITITPNGASDVILSADTVILGDSNANATLTTNGTGDLILNTNSGSSSGSITIADAANGIITIQPNGAGHVTLGYGDLKANIAGSNQLINNNVMVDHGANRAWVQTHDQSAVSANTQRIYANNDLVSVQLTGATGTNFNNRIRQNTTTELDLNGINWGYNQTGYKSSILGSQGAVNIINKNATAATITQAQGINGYMAVGDGGNLGDVTITDAIASGATVELIAPSGRTTTATNGIGVYSFLVSSGAGTKSMTNWYALFAADTSATATNKYGLYIENDEHQSRLGTIERYREKQNALTSSSTITVDADLAPVHTVTLATNTGFVITGLSTGQTVTLIITQDGTGSRTATFGTSTSTAVKFPGGAPTLSTAASAIDTVRIYNDGTNFLGTIEKAYA